MNIFLFFSAVFAFTFLVGHLLEKIRVPWIFAALLMGSLLAFYNPFDAVTQSDTFVLLAQLGMYFLLFLVGLELNLGELKKKKGLILRSTGLIILTEGIVGSLLVHALFGYSWAISGLVALSFATVGEAILIPILDEFKMVNTSIGQTIIGIGTADDLIEILTLVLASVLVGADAGVNLWMMFGALGVLLLLTMGLVKLGKKSQRFPYKSDESLFLVLLLIFFLFVGVGTFADSAPLGALLAGMGLRVFLPKERLAVMESHVKTMTYGFFGPLFFVWVGSELDWHYLALYPLLILLVVAVSNITKLVTAYLTLHKAIGTKASIFVGIGISVRFSTSIIIIQFLLNQGLIRTDLFSVIVGSSIVFKFIVPVLFSQLAVRWGFSKA